MDPEVWKHLADNEDLLRLVLARIPWDTNKRLRSVSKLWSDILSEPSFLTWESMLTDRNFYSNHPDFKWLDRSSRDTVNSDVSTSETEHQKGSLAEPVCLLSTSRKTYAVANFDFHQWIELPPLKQLPFGEWEDFTVSGATEGLLLLENQFDQRTPDFYKLDRYLLNPLTNDYVKLPPVPKLKRHRDSHVTLLGYPMFLTVDKDKFVTVIATEFYHRGGRGILDSRLQRVLIWHQRAIDWEPVHPYVLETRSISIRTVEHAVFAGGHLFLHTKYREDGTQGHRVLKCERQAGNLGHNVDFLDYSPANPILHLFQHRGVLMCLTGTWKVLFQFRQIQAIRVCRFDHANERWFPDLMSEMPHFMMLDLYNSLPKKGVWRFYVDCEGDILCIGNRFQARHFFFYNLVTHMWCASSANEYGWQNENYQSFFLWSPKNQVNGALVQI